MSLEGSLETVALPEVLQLLSDTSKTGELLVRGDRGDGRLWFAQGRLAGFQVARTEQSADALFDLLRNAGGRFSFEADAEVADDAHKVGEEENELRPVLDVAQARLAEWTEIVAVVPSLKHVVTLASKAPRARLHLDSAQWELLVAVGEGRTVEDILERASLPEFEGCKSLKVLVNSGLAQVAEPAVEPAVEVVEEPVGDLVVEPVIDEPVAEVEGEAVLAEAIVESGQEEAEDPAFGHLPAYEPSAHEAPLDPHEYVFSAPATPEQAELTDDETPGELAPWSVALAEGSDDDLDRSDFVPQQVPYPEAHDDHASNGSNGANGARAALEALLAEIPADEQAGGEVVHESSDGLADRGPWTSNELDQMSTWHHEEDPQEVTSWGSFQVSTNHSPYSGQAHEGDSGVNDEYGGADPEAVDHSDEDEEPEDKPEQVNRGLLLKFLSSVRS